MRRSRKSLRNFPASGKGEEEPQAWQPKEASYRDLAVSPRTTLDRWPTNPMDTRGGRCYSKRMDSSPPATCDRQRSRRYTTMLINTPMIPRAAWPSPRVVADKVLVPKAHPVAARSPSRCRTAVPQPLCRQEPENSNIADQRAGHRGRKCEGSGKGGRLLGVPEAWQLGAQQPLQAPRWRTEGQRGGWETVKPGRTEGMGRQGK